LSLDPTNSMPFHANPADPTTLPPVFTAHTTEPVRLDTARTLKSLLPKYTRPLLPITGDDSIGKDVMGHDNASNRSVGPLYADCPLWYGSRK
jgi:hypothetical protein